MTAYRFQNLPNSVVCACSIGVSLAFGCSGRSPTRIDPPKMDAAAIAKAAIDAYDTDKDGALSAEELAKVPALEGAKSIYDKNTDGKITAEEIADRIRTWQASKVGLMTVGCSVTLDGKPLEGARVELVGEPVMAEYLPTAAGTTDRQGRTGMSLDVTTLPADQRGVAGVRCGLYRVRVTHPTQKIPATYNIETSLGQEIAVDNYEAVNIRLDLKSQ
jgi:hypothetical protein